VDPDEACDDGNLASGDGCSAGCAVEPGHVFEIEPNDDGTPAIASSDFLAAAAAGPYATAVLIHAALVPYGDDDVFAVSNPGSSPVTVIAETFGREGPGGCEGVDTQLRLRDAEAALLGFDDDSGIGGCSRLELTLEPGAKCYIVVTEPGDNSVIPAYVLSIGFE
jgi:cysteine-rich repeat protein